MKKIFDQQVCLKLAGPLRSAVEADAATRERSVSWVIRKILINHYAQRVAESSGSTNIREVA
jgi:hypothetical protein